MLVTPGTHTAATHTNHRLNLLVRTGFLNHYDEVHVLLGIEQAAIDFYFFTPKVEHANTFGENQQ